MNSWHRLEKETSDDEIEGQVCRSDGQKKTTILHPEGRLLQWWNMIFAVSCVVAVSMDPLFFYLPIINGDNKCLRLDKKLKIVAITLRSITDCIYLLNIVLQFICPYIDEDSRKLGRTKVVTNARQIAKRYFFSRYFVIDFLAILPLPHVLIPNIFSEKTSSKFFNTRKLVNAVLVLQYVPRVLRIHLSRKILTGSGSNRVRIASFEAAFNLFLYILSSHVLGAIWYFFSIGQEMTCWQIACENHGGCTTRAFRCDRSLGNYTFLNDYCPVNPPNTTLFDFGIFLQGLQSGIVTSTNFPQKLFHCLWWGLRNLSSLGQNLQTSTGFWENCFAVCISISGLLLFLYFIGNLQIYMQVEISIWLENEKSKEAMKAKERDIEMWMNSKELPLNIMRRVMPHVRRMIEEKKDIDERNPLPHLPIEFAKEIKRHICWPLLKRVPMFKRMDERLLDLVCDRLKPVFYTQESYVVWEGDLVDEMLFIARGRLLTMTTNDGRTGFFNSEYLKAGDYCGEVLLTWALDNSSSNLPISTKTVQSLTKVEAFSLKADDMNFVASQFQLGGKQLRDTFRYYSRRWRNWAACIIQAAWHCHCEKKLEESLRREKENRLQDALANAGGSSQRRNWAASIIQTAWNCYREKKLEKSLRRIRKNRLQHALAKVRGRGSEQRRNWAASVIQAAWRHYIHEKKLKESLRVTNENRLQDELAKAGGSSPSLGATIYASRFAANALRTRKARVQDRIPPTHIPSETSRAHFYI